MLLFVLMLTIAIAGLSAIEFGQAARPRAYRAWNDDIERRLLRNHSDSGNWW